MFTRKMALVGLLGFALTANLSGCGSSGHKAEAPIGTNHGSRSVSTTMPTNATAGTGTAGTTMPPLQGYRPSRIWTKAKLHRRCLGHAKVPTLSPYRPPSRSQQSIRRMQPKWPDCSPISQVCCDPSPQTHL
jgi:hypothetical protein